MAQVGLRSRVIKSMTCIHSATFEKPGWPLNVRESESLDLSPSKTTDFAGMITAGCNKFLDSCYKVAVKQDDRTDEYLKLLKHPHTKLKPSQSNRKTLVTSNSSKETIASKHVRTESSTTIMANWDEITIVVYAVYNTAGKLCEILLLNQEHVIRGLMQVFGLVTPHFPQCTKMSFKNCRINGFIVHEMKKFLPLTSITEICFDGCPLQESSFSLLLDQPCRLTNLSLSRCKLYDEGCVQIASKLHFSEAAEVTLSVLNLSSNHITDVGATSIGEALRTNRHLRYLNLADNSISDDGADRILQTLIDFPLTRGEIVDRQQIYIDFLRAKQCFADRRSNSGSKSRIRRTSSSKSVKKGLKVMKTKTTSLENYILNKSVVITEDSVNKVNHPFMPPSTKLIDGCLHCTGNMVLCYLNLSYNQLSYFTVKKINYVLLQQGEHDKLGQTGLLKVVIDGNPMPESCDELDLIRHMLQKNVSQTGHKNCGSDNRKNTSKISTISEKIRK